jgi:outer membrane protein TolC
LAARTASADVAGGESQRFVRELDIPGKWWTLFRSHELNALIDQALKANPSLDSAVAALQQASENVHAQEGKWFPLVQANYTPMRQPVAQSVPGTEAIPPLTTFNLHTAQALVSYTFDAWGLNRRTVESLQAQAESQRFLVEAAYLTLTSNVVAALVQEASLRDQIAATRKLIDLNTEMLGIFKSSWQPVTRTESMSRPRKQSCMRPANGRKQTSRSRLSFTRRAAWPSSCAGCARPQSDVHA